MGLEPCNYILEFMLFDDIQWKNILFGNEDNVILVGNEGRDKFSYGSGHDKILDFNQLDIKSNDCEEF